MAETLLRLGGAPGNPPGARLYATVGKHNLPGRAIGGVVGHIVTCEGLHMYVLLFCRQCPGRFLLDSLHERGSVAVVRRSRLELGFSYRVFLLDPLSSAFRATVTLIKLYRE